MVFPFSIFRFDFLCDFLKRFFPIFFDPFPIRFPMFSIWEGGEAFVFFVSIFLFRFVRDFSLFFPIFHFGSLDTFFLICCSQASSIH